MSYREDVKRTANPDLTKDELLVNGAMGLAGEAGEVIDLVKKIIFHGKPFDREKLINELGDVRWYLELVSIYLDAPMEEIEAKNIEKLRQRYPEGFSSKASEERKDVK
jgi:NTP pyrophosphatase (non-canonical NTP hydrolase)